MSAHSTPKMSQLLSNSFFGGHRLPQKITKAVVQDTVAGPVAQLEQKVQGALSNRPSESNRKALDAMQDVLNACLTPSNPMNVFGGG